MDFKLFTGTLKAYETESGDRYVSGTTSSTIRDLHGDAMAMSALKSMEDTAKQNMTVFLNHNYNVPEDLFGSATDARIVKRMDEETGQEVYDLDIDVKVCPEDENPQAMQAYRAIKRGVKLGLSIGARVEHADKKRDEKSGIDTYVINKVRLLEASVVGIPANQRSYLHNAVKSLRSKPEENEVEHAIIHDLDDAVKAAGDFKVGDMVTWGSSGGAARGKITKIVREGSVNVPDSSISITAEKNDPAVLIRVYDGEKSTDRIVGHKMSALRATKSFDDLVAKAVEIEGQPSPSNAALIACLQQYHANNIAFYLEAHGAHWNVVGEDFSEYHELFEEIYEDAQGAIDPIAELLRKLNAPAMGDIREVAAKAAGETVADDADPESLAEAVYAANEALLDQIVSCINEAAKINQQGILNFLADRQDMHQKWSWQLRASLAPEEVEPEPAETPEMPAENNSMQAAANVANILEKNMSEETTPQVAEETPEVAPEAEPAVAVEPAVEPVAVEAAADVEEYREVSEADVAEVLASATSNRLALETGVPLQGEAEALVAEPVAAEPVADEVAVEAAPAEAAPIDAVIEEPVAELASEDQGVEPVVEPSDAEKSSDVDDIGKIVEVAKSALDAAKTAQQEVESLRKEITELAAAKAKVEKDLESANNVIDRLSAEPVGRKLITKATEQRHSDATWLHPYIQRVLEAQD